MCSQFHCGARAATQRAPQGQGCRKEAVWRMTRLSATEWERKEQLRPCGQRWRWGCVGWVGLVSGCDKLDGCFCRDVRPITRCVATHRGVVGLVAPAAALLGAEREEAPAGVLEAGVVLVRVDLAGRAPVDGVVVRFGWCDYRCIC